MPTLTSTLFRHYYVSVDQRERGSYQGFNVHVFRYVAATWGSKFFAHLPGCSEYRAYEKACRTLETVAHKQTTTLGELQEHLQALVDSVKGDSNKTGESGTLVDDARAMVVWLNTVKAAVTRHSQNYKSADLAEPLHATLAAATELPPGSDGDNTVRSPLSLR